MSSKNTFIIDQDLNGLSKKEVLLVWIEFYRMTNVNENTLFRRAKTP
jgi:hypothetical protein